MTERRQAHGRVMPSRTTNDSAIVVAKPMSRQRRVSILIGLIALVIAATLIEGMKAGADKVLPGPMHRHRDAIAIALTLVQYGKWLGYASYRKINYALNDNGLAIQPDDVRATGFKDYFEVMRHPEAVDRAIAAASSLKDVASRGLYFHNDSENGIAIFYIISFLMFGKHIAGFFYTYMLLFAVSVAIFAATFIRRPVVLLFLLAVVSAHYLIVLMCQDLPFDVGAVHGSRFISVMTVVAMFQFMLLTRFRAPPRLPVVLGTALQVLLVMLVLNARETGLWQIIAVLAFVGGSLLRRLLRAAPSWRPALWPAGVLIAGLVALQIHLSTGLNSHYYEEGGAGLPLWPHVSEALHNNPHRTERFGIPSDIPVRDPDRVDYYLFKKEIDARGLPLRDFLVNDGDWRLRANPEWDFKLPQFDAVFRDIVLRQIAQNPLYAIESFLVYQPMDAARTIASFWLQEVRHIALWPLLLLPIGAAVAGRCRVGMGRWLAAPVGVTLVCSIIPVAVAVVLAMRLVDFMLMLLVALLTLICCAVPLNAARARLIFASWRPTYPAAAQAAVRAKREKAQR